MSHMCLNNILIGKLEHTLDSTSVIVNVQNCIMVTCIKRTHVLPFVGGESKAQPEHFSCMLGHCLPAEELYMRSKLSSSI